MVNLLSLVGIALKMFLWGSDMGKLMPQVVLCGLMVSINAPVYESMFLQARGQVHESFAVEPLPVGRYITVERYCVSYVGSNQR
ncbi:hypothetical protein V6N13_117934 [Hibiscus sabdariffa]